MRKILWFDLETTGLYSGDHNIVQLAAIADVEGKIKDTFNVTAAPSSDRIDKIDLNALSIHGTTKDELLKVKTTQKDLYESFHRFLQVHVDPYNTSDKFIPAGYNVGFDLGFLRALFLMHNDKYFGSFFTSASLDVMSFVAEWSAKNTVLRNYKLKNVCETFEISLTDAHDALADVSASRDLYNRLRNLR